MILSCRPDFLTGSSVPEAVEQSAQSLAQGVPPILLREPMVPANLVGVIDIGAHAMLDHLLHQQGVWLVTDLAIPEKGALGATGAI